MKRNSLGQFANVRTKLTSFFRTLAINYCIGFTSTVLVIAGLANLGTTAQQMFQWVESASAPTTYAQVRSTSTPSTISTTKIDTVPPVLKRIAKCESKDKQYTKSGKTVRGAVTPSDLGKYQINEVYWGQTAHDMGFDLYTEAGNEAMAIWIYENIGTDPWNSSKHCWK